MKQNSYRYWKRCLDLGLAMLLLLPFLAIGLVLCLVSLWVFKGQLFFRQQRLGYRNHVFYIYKFASLKPEQQNGKALSLDERQTAWGNFLRNYSLDELPQLFNIVKGDMSFVGPRPLLPEYELLYSPAQARRHLVKPGLTGLAQVNGRNALSWIQKMDFDQQYVKQFGFRTDMKILLKTLKVVWEGQEINIGSGPAHATAAHESVESGFSKLSRA